VSVRLSAWYKNQSSNALMGQPTHDHLHLRSCDLCHLSSSPRLFPVRERAPMNRMTNTIEGFVVASPKPRLDDGSGTIFDLCNTPGSSNLDILLYLGEPQQPIRIDLPSLPPCSFQPAQSVSPSLNIHRSHPIFFTEIIWTWWTRKYVPDK
jgi:hypothetical protein